MHAHRRRICWDGHDSIEPGESHRFRYALYRSYVLLSDPPIEPITEHILDQFPLRKAQRLGGRAYESPALPLSYSASAGILPQAHSEPLPAQWIDDL